MFAGNRKLFALSVAIAAGFCAPVARAQEAPGSRFFAEQKEYSTATFVLNDYLEFSVFDMSKLNLFINSKKIELRPLPVPDGAAGTKVPPEQAPAMESQAEREIKTIFPEIPKFLYKQLKTALWQNKVPVTLFATDSPPYAKPIKLYVKLKKVSLAPSYTDKKGETVQPVGIKIYGQLKEKGEDKVLMRFYDAQTAEFPLGQNQAGEAFNAMAAKMMENLSLYMKTKY